MPAPEGAATFVRMSTGEDWLFRPALRRLCLFESLVDGTLDLEMVATMNEAVDVMDANQRRAEAQKERRDV